ncbi:hypothetical protein KP806_21280 [Paenibacillus sp. N4]|uniref:CBO0543 family protein n=1 Tax=Paenibacillus vietnamensis TaxID=2590547 RepID=UPI001CD189F5|nr:CBO0543 family protein [Paenibacillus vietnamensis]MCA0757598.1 hypothetical protein [Paenibacillus vietnamensis]
MDEMIKHETKLSDMVMDHWLQDDLFTWRWWLLLGAGLLAIIVFYKALDRSRKAEIMLYGFFIALLATFLDILGWNLHLWAYPHKLLPMCTPLLPVDYVVLPIFYMLIYQRFRSWKSFFWASVVLAFVMSFILEPVFIWIEIYKPLAWKHVYSFPIYIANGLLGKWVIAKLTK